MLEEIIGRLTYQERAYSSSSHYLKMGLDKQISPLLIEVASNNKELAREHKITRIECTLEVLFHYKEHHCYKVQIMETSSCKDFHNSTTTFRREASPSTRLISLSQRSTYVKSQTSLTVSLWSLTLHSLSRRTAQWARPTLNSFYSISYKSSYPTSDKCLISNQKRSSTCSRCSNTLTKSDLIQSQQSEHQTLLHSLSVLYTGCTSWRAHIIDKPFLAQSKKLSAMKSRKRTKMSSKSLLNNRTRIQTLLLSKIHNVWVLRKNYISNY